jgi:hypothetical protein
MTPSTPRTISIPFALLLVSAFSCGRSGSAQHPDAASTLPPPGGGGGAGGTSTPSGGGSGGSVVPVGATGGSGGAALAGGAPGSGGLTSTGGAAGSGGTGTHLAGGTTGSGGAGPATGATGGGGGTSGSTRADGGQGGQVSCGTSCKTTEHCCASSCSACLPQDMECSLLACSPDGGGYAPYPPDCTGRASGDVTFCTGKAGRPHCYLCTTSVLAAPCVVIQLGSDTGNLFCCP